MNLIQRIQVPIPEYLKVLKGRSLTRAVASSLLLATSLSLPAAVITIAVGSVITVVSHTAVHGEDHNLDADTYADTGQSQ